MKPFDIGWVPKNWRRGDPLSVSLPPNSETRGLVGRRLLPTATLENFSEEVLYYVEYADVARVAAWLKWWDDEV